MKLLFLSLLLFTGCEKTITQFDQMTTGYHKICVDNVSYLMTGSNIFIQLDLDGMPVECEK